MTEVQSSSFGQPTLLLDDPMDIQDTDSPFTANAAKIRTGGVNKEFTANGLLGDASFSEGDASMLDMRMESQTEVGDVGFGGALPALPFKRVT